MADRKSYLLRLPAEVHEALERWARDDLRSVNAEIEFLLRKALQAAGRLSKRDPPGAEPHAPERERVS